jgi:hypothetical protein
VVSGWWAEPVVKELAPNEEQFYQQGAREVDEKIGK